MEIPSHIAILKGELKSLIEGTAIASMVLLEISEDLTRMCQDDRLNWLSLEQAADMAQKIMSMNGNLEGVRQWRSPLTK